MTTTRSPEVWAPGRTAPVPEEADRRTRTAWGLSVLAVVLMVASSAAGLAVDGVYGGELSVASMLRAYDLVTLVVVAPALVVALTLARRGSERARLVWVGMLAASVYTYAYYLFGTGFNDAFLVHVGAFAVALAAFPLGLSTLDIAGVTARVSPRTPTRWIAGLLAFLAVGLGGMWVFYSVRFAVTGDVPAGSALVETPGIVHLGYALDLAVLVPAYALAAVLLWRRTGWGYVLAAVMLVSGAVHQLGYLVALPLQVAAGVPGAAAFDPLEPLIAAAFLTAAVVLVAGLRRPSPAMSANRAPK